MNQTTLSHRTASRLALTGFLSICLLATGCDLNSIKDPIVLTDVEDEFFLDMWEEITPQGRSFQLSVATIADQPCRNGQVAYETSIRQSEIDVSLLEIIQPEDCVAGQAPAVAEIELGQLTDQFYAISIDLREAIVNRGRLTVDQEAYSLDLFSDYGLRPLRSELRRIPSNQFWGYISYPEALQSVADSLEKDLTAFGNYQLPQAGYYGYFTVANGRLAIKDQPEDQPFRTWIMPISPNQTRNVQDLIEAYRREYATQGLDIWFMDGRGRTY